MIGPSLLDLQELVKASEEALFFIFLACSIGYLSGSITTGLIYDFFNSQILLILLLLIKAAFFIATPWNNTIIGLSICILFMNLCCGGIECSGNVRCLGLWGKFCGPFLQCLHFSFSFGSFLAPIIAAPFLSSEEDSNNTIIIANRINVGHFLKLDNQSNENDSNIQFVYAIFGIYCIISAIFILIMYFIERKEVVNERKEQNDENKLKNEKPISIKYKIAITGLAITFFLFSIGTECGFARLLTTFAVYHDVPGLNKQIGAYMTSAFFIGFTFFRLVAIFLVHFFGSRITLVICCTLIVASNLILIFFANSMIGLWIGVILSRFGTSPLYPTLYVLIDKYVTITSKIS